MEHRDAVGDLARAGHVVGDRDRRGAELAHRSATISSLITSAMIGSSPVVGSSKNMISGSARDRARQRHPLLHAARQLGRRTGRRPRRRDRPGRASRSRPSRASARGMPLAVGSSPKATFSHTGRLSNRARALEQHAELAHELPRAGGASAARPSPGRRSVIEPRSGRIRPRTHFSSTDLPVPEPPITTSDFALADVEVDAVEHPLRAERSCAGRGCGSWSGLASSREKQLRDHVVEAARIRIEAETTALVVAAPTPWAPPLRVVAPDSSPSARRGSRTPPP